MPGARPFPLLKHLTSAITARTLPVATIATMMISTPSATYSAAWLMTSLAMRRPFLAAYPAAVERADDDADEQEQDDRQHDLRVREVLVRNQSGDSRVPCRRRLRQCDAMARHRATEPMTGRDAGKDRNGD